MQPLPCLGQRTPSTQRALCSTPITKQLRPAGGGEHLWRHVCTLVRWIRVLFLEVRWPVKRAVVPATAWFLLAFALVLGSPSAARADDGEKDTADETLSPYFFVEGGESAVDALPLLGTDVQVNVSGVIANVEVKQTYKNAGGIPLHARYVFPASTRAAVHGLTLRVGQRLVRAKIREREQARAEFEAAKREGKTASLLEQDRPNVFSMGLSNILPGDEIDVTLSYTEPLVPEGGVYEFVYPTVVGPRYSGRAQADSAGRDQFIKSPFLHAGQPPRHGLNIRGTVQSAFPIKNLTTRGHQIRTTWQDKKHVSFQLEASEKHSSNRDFILRYQLADSAIQTGLMLYESEGEKFFLAMVQAPERSLPEDIPAREFVFVLDVSGSMHGFPLDTAKTLLGDLVTELRPTDTFNVLYFSGGSELWATQSKAATPANLKEALGFLQGVAGSGGTELLPALARALSLPAEVGRSRSFIVVTDGYIGAEAEVFDHIREHLGEANVYCFGIGSGVNRYLVEGIAKAGQGVPFVVTAPGEAPKVATRFRKYIQAPILTRVRASFEGFDAYDVEPRTLPDVLADRPIVLSGKWRGTAAGKIFVRGQTGKGPFLQKLTVKDADRTADARSLPYLWARTRIGGLTDFPGAPITDTERTEVVRLGLQYNLLTEFTSFIAVAEQVRNPDGDGIDVAQPSALPEGVSDLSVGGDLAGGVVGADEPPLGLLLLLGLAWLLLVPRRRRTA